MDPATKERLDSLERRLERHEANCFTSSLAFVIAAAGVMGFLFMKVMGW